MFGPTFCNLTNVPMPNGSASMRSNISASSGQNEQGKKSKKNLGSLICFVLYSILKSQILIDLMTAICSCVFYIFMILLSTLIIVFRVFYSILQFRYHISFHWTKYWQRGLATESLQSVWSSLISWVVLTGPRNTQSWLSPFFCPTSAWVDTFTHRSVTFSTRMSDLSHVNFPVPFLLQKKRMFWVHAENEN